MKALFFLLLLFSNISFARDALVLKTNDCKFHKGFILDYEEDVTFLDTTGEIYKIEFEKINLLLIYGIMVSPFDERFIPNKKLTKYTRKVYLKKSDEEIIGFPFQYIEDLIFFLSESGQVYIFSLNEIDKIENSNFSKSFRSKITVNFDYEDSIGDCTDKKASKLDSNIKSQKPSRILGDKIKISQYLDEVKTNYRGFLDLQERAVFYPRSFLYPKRSRLGLYSFKNTKVNFPVYFQWATGEDYNFQSLNAFGGIKSRVVPNNETNSAFVSDFKSHFFHGYFEMNLMGYSAGKIPSDYNLNSAKTTNIIMDYNYMALMGVDWKKFSISYGGIYISPTLILENSETRQLSANKISPVLRLMYTESKTKLKLLYYRTKDAFSNTVGSSEQILSNSIILKELDEKIIDWNFESTYYRAGLDYDYNDEVSFFTDILYGQGDYHEKSKSLKNSIDFKTREITYGVKKQFGYYITLTFFAVKSKLTLDTKLNNIEETFKTDKNLYGGRFELLF